MNDDYNELEYLVQQAEENQKFQTAEEIARIRSSARVKAFKAQQEISNNWNKAVNETFGSQAEYDKWANENPEEHRTLLLEGMANFAKTAHKRARDDRGRFLSTPAGKKKLQEISESRTNGSLSSNDALQKIVNSVLFGR